MFPTKFAQTVSLHYELQIEMFLTEYPHGPLVQNGCQSINKNIFKQHLIITGPNLKW